MVQWRNGEGRTIVTGVGAPVDPEPFVTNTAAIYRFVDAIAKEAPKRSVRLRALNPHSQGGDDANEKGRAEPMPKTGPHAGIASFFSAPEEQRLKDVALLQCDSPHPCAFCGHRPAATDASGIIPEPPRKRQRTRKTQSKDATPIPVPSLCTLAMRRVLVHYRRPSQFEKQLSTGVATRVWEHLPLRFLSKQRVARFYHPNCGCPTEMWIRGRRVMFIRQTLCVRCLGLGGRIKSELEADPRGDDCDFCKRRYGRCGCVNMPHAEISIYYDEFGNKKRIGLYVNRSDWRSVCVFNLVGQGYLHGRMDWRAPTPICSQCPPRLQVVPPSLNFFCGMRGSDTTQFALPNGQTLHTFSPTMEVTPSRPIGSNGDGDQSPLLLTYVVEQPLPSLLLEKKHRRVGASLFRTVRQHLRASRTVAVFRKAAHMYMETLLNEHKWRLDRRYYNCRLDGVYREMRGVDWPTFDGLRGRGPVNITL